MGILASAISLTLGGLVPLIEKSLVPKAQEYYDKYPEKNFSKFLAKFFHLDEDNRQSYKERIATSLETLNKATGEIDKVINEISEISEEKQITIRTLEKELEELSLRESELKQKIKTLENVPVESIKHFEEILNKGDKKGARRDYILFASGVLLSSLVSIILYLIAN